MYFEIILLAYLAYRNSVRAKLKGKNPVLWAIVTVVAYFTTLMIGGFVVIFNFCKDIVDLKQLSSLDVAAREAASQQLVRALAGNPLHVLTIELFGIGGFLFVRYILDRNPDKKEPEVHWMDRMGE